MDVQGLPGLAALVELPALAAHVSIRSSFSFLLRSLGVPKDTPRAALPHLIPAAAAVSLLQLLSANLPEDVDLHEAAAALSPSGAYGYGPDLQVQLDALLGLSCLLSSGSTQDKLQLCFWTLDRDSSGSLDLQQVLGVIPAAQQASAAARILVQEATLQTLYQEAADPQAAADKQQGEAVLREVLSRAFLEADPQSTGLIQPGEQLTQLLFAAAAQLTSIMVAATTVSREGTGYGSRASSASTTPPWSVSASPVRMHYNTPVQPAQQQQPQQHLQSQPGGQQQPQQQPMDGQHMQPPQQQQALTATVAAAAPNSGRSSVPQGPETALSTHPSLGTTAMADVVIVDSEGALLHYQAPVEHAAAAACQGRVPVGGGAGGMLVYGPGTSRHSLNGPGDSAGQQGLAPASSLLQHLELLEAQQQQQQQQQHGGASEEASLFLTPNGTVSAEDGNTAGTGDGEHHSPFIQHSHQQQRQQPHKQRQQQQPPQQQQQGSVSRRVLSQLNLRSGHSKSSPGSSTNNSLRRIFVGSPFGTISESVNAAGGTSSSVETGRVEGAGNAAAADDEAAAAAPVTAAGAITNTATNVMTTIQSNVLAVVVKLLLHCGMCCLITMMVGLGDAAIVTGLHVGAKLPLSVSFAVAVAANLVLVLLLLAMLVVARMMNAATNDRMAQMANRPEAQQLDQILETMKAAVQALKTTEQQQQQGAFALGPGNASNRFTGSHFLASRASSMRGDVEQGRPGAAGGLGRSGSGPLSGPLAAAGKLRAVWSAVGRVAGFLPPAQDTGGSETIAGPFGSAVQLEGGVAAGQHSSTSWGASSGPDGVSTSPPGGTQQPAMVAAAAAVRAELGGGRVGGGGGGGGGDGGGGVRPVSPQSRQLRVAGTAAPQSAPGASPVAMKEAYPQL